MHRCRPHTEQLRSRRARRDGIREIAVTKIRCELRNVRRREEWLPLLRLSGHWLAECGFEIGSRVFVSAEQGRLIIMTADSALADMPPVERMPPRLRARHRLHRLPLAAVRQSLIAAARVRRPAVCVDLPPLLRPPVSVARPADA